MRFNLYFYTLSMYNKSILWLFCFDFFITEFAVNMCQYKGAVQLENTVVQILPNDYEAERSCIGCILLSSDCAGAVFERVIIRSFTKA